MSDLGRQNLAARIFKGVIFALISFGMVGGNFLIEGKAYQEAPKTEGKLVAFDYGKDNLIGEDGIIRFDTEVPKPDMQVVKAENGYVFNLKNGHFWGNFRLSDDGVAIVSDRVVVVPDHAVFDASFVSGKLELAVYSGDVYLGFLPEGVDVKEQVDAYSGVFMNRLLVAQGNKVTVTMSKVTDQIRPLLYSKLVKEFKYIQISAEQRQGPWVLKNLAFDTQNRENRKHQFESEVILRGSSASEGFVASILQWTQANLTFIPDKRQKIQLRRLFAYLEDAIYYAKSGDLEQTKQYLNDFDVYITDVEFTSGEENGFHHYFEEYVKGLNVFEPGDAYYEVEKFLLNKQFFSKDQQGLVVAAFWQDVYEAIGKNEVAARESLDNYYNYLDKYLVILEGGDQAYYQNYLAYQNQLFDNLLLKYPVFYQDSYFAIKDALEMRYLALFQGHDKEEMSQDFISEKIDFLRRVKKFFFDGSIQIVDAKKVFSRLIAEIDALMPKDKGEVAVIALFESRLKDIADFWGYLSSPQYQTKASGVTEEDRYNTYLKEKDKIWSFVNIREDVLGEKIQKSMTVADVKDEVIKQLMISQGVSSVEVGEIKDAGDRYIDVNLVISGYPVKAVYDRVTTLVKEVTAYDKDISKGSVKVEALLAVLQDKFADLAKDSLAAKDEGVSIESTAQRYARVYIAKVLADEGFVVEMKNVSLVDEEKAIYRVQEITLLANEAMVVTFDLDMKGEVVTNLFVMNKGEPQLIDGAFTLAELKAFIQADGKIDKGEPLVDGGAANPSGPSAGGKVSR